MEPKDPFRDRYARQLALDSIGEDGQARIAGAQAVVVGGGALGSNSSELLVRMGFGRVRVIDRDVVEVSNLHRFRVLGEKDVGRPKATALEEALEAIRPDAHVEGVVEDLTAGNVLALLEGATVVVDALDNMDGRYLLNDACLELDVPWVYGGVVSTGGMVAPFPVGGPCLRCLFPEPPAPGVLPTCESEGVHPSAPAVVAAVQVAQASRMVVGTDVPARLVAMDLWSDDWRVVDIERRGDCPACAGGVRKFLDGAAEETVTSLCGQQAVHINPGRPADLDLTALEREWSAHGEVTRSGPVLMLDLGDLRLQVFKSGRAMVKGTTDIARAKTVYARYVGH